MSIEYSLDRVLLVMVVAAYAVLFSSVAIYAKECGVRQRVLGIANGTNAYENEFPWQISLNLYKQQSNGSIQLELLCGGSILNDNLVITAAHCVDDYKNGKSENVEYVVLVGSHRRSGKSKNEQTIKVKKIYIHPSYSNQTLEGDIALLELAQPIGLNRGKLNAICLGKPEHKTEGKDVVVTGWGTLSDYNLKFADVLQRATVTVENLEQCKKLYSEIDLLLVTDANVCAGRESGPCYRDDGGPLQYEIDGRWYLLGISSWSLGCGSQKYPAVYTLVPHYLEFIEEKINQTSSKVDSEGSEVFVDYKDFENSENSKIIDLDSGSKNILINSFINIFLNSVNFIKNNTYNFS